MKQLLTNLSNIFTGAVLMAFLWFMHTSYQTATDQGYTPAARAHMNYLAEVYNTDKEPVDYNNIPRLDVSMIDAD